MFAIFIFSFTTVSASDMNDTAIDSDDTSQMELSASNEMDADNLKLSEENTTITYANNVESVSGKIDSAVMGADTGTYSGLSEEIGHGGNIELKHAYYTYDTGENIEITVDNSVIDGKGAVIDMAGSYVRAFYVSGSGVIIKNLTIKNSKYKFNRGGAIYFNYPGTVTNCNFTDNDVFNGGAIWFSNTGNVTNCNFINNHAYADGGAIYCSDMLNIKNCLFDSNQVKGSKFQCYGGAIRAKSTMVDNSTFINNCAEDYGGAIYADSLTFANTPCYFIGNVAKDNQGGAIYADK